MAFWNGKNRSKIAREHGGFFAEPVTNGISNIDKSCGDYSYNFNLDGDEDPI